MKITFPLITCLAASLAVAQDQKDLSPADPLAPPTPEAPTTPPDAKGRPSKPKRIEVRAGAVPGGLPQVEATSNEFGGGGGGTGGRISIKSNRVVETDAFLPRSAKTGRTLVIQTSNPDPDAATDAEEDLSVMALILRKATGARGEERRVAMGIEVFGSSSGARNIYLQDYGALFLLGVPFPLVAPSDKADEIREKDSTSSDWQEAREEFLNDGLALEQKLVRAWQTSRGGMEAYDEEKVQALKNSLIESLKNASHIRALKAGEYVTVVIQGGESIRTEKAGEGRNSSKSKRRAETVMTLRAKKSDIDAFAKGNLQFPEFSKLVGGQTYFRRGDSSVATSLFLAPTR